jgi:MFS transporter, OFA family, oxalate/formate antiporter
MSLTDSKNKGWFVTSIGLLINLALGILYAWSVFKESILQSINSGSETGFNWDLASLNDPYAVCILAFAFSMTFAGKLQDKRGPSFTAKIGGLLVGTGFILASLSTNYYLWILGFGIMGGTGIGFGYSATTPAALKWFSSAKTGLIAGIVVSGFGLAPVFIAPLASFLVGGFGLQTTMMIFGIVFLVFISGLAFFLNNPPAGYVPEEAVKSNNAHNQLKNQVEYDSFAMLKTLRFYLMWVIFFIGAGAGLMVIGSISGIAKASMGESAFVAVAIMAVGNALGRVVAGIVSDKMAKSSTLFLILVSQSGLMFLCYFIMDTNPSATIIVLIATLIGFNYGANLSLFPSFTKGFWGMKNFGMNYGVLMSAWGLGGFVFSRLAQSLLASTGSNNTSFLIAGCCLGFCLYLTVVLLEIKSMN